jgi:hypothetical protein
MSFRSQEKKEVSVVVITFRLHRKGHRFEPGTSYTFLFTYFGCHKGTSLQLGAIYS